MPFSEDNYSAVAASSDGVWTACYGNGMLFSLDVEQRNQVAKIPWPSIGPVTLGIGSKNRLWVISRREAQAVVSLLTLPELEPVTETGIDADIQLVTMVSEFCVAKSPEEVLILRYDSSRIVKVASVRGHFHVVAAAPDNLLLLASDDKINLVDLSKAGRIKYRLNLPLPSPPLFGGYVGAGRLIWFATTLSPQKLLFFRASDGRLLYETALEGNLLDAVSSARFPLVAAVVATEDGVKLDVIRPEHKDTMQIATAGEPAAICWIDTSQPQCFMIDHDSKPSLVAVPLSPAATAPSIDAAPANLSPAKDATQEALKPKSAAERLNAWRSQLQNVVSTMAIVQPAGDLPVETAPADKPKAHIADSPTVPPEKRNARDALMAWGMAALFRETIAPRLTKGFEPLDRLVERFALDRNSEVLLGLLYVRWLGGFAATGIPVATLAARLAGNEAWNDAFARGWLGQVGWIHYADGCTILHRALGRFFDELAPTVSLIGALDDTAKPALELKDAMLLEVENGADLSAKAEAVASALGRPVGVIELENTAAAQHELQTRAVEIHLHGGVALVPAEHLIGIELPRTAGPVLLAATKPVMKKFKQLSVYKY